MRKRYLEIYVTNEKKEKEKRERTKQVKATTSTI